MNIDNLLPYQPAHVEALMRSLVRYGAALDASETGVGKTFCALAIARQMGVVPFVLGPKNSRATWLRAGVAMGVPVEWINYEMVRGRRSDHGGIEVDSIVIQKNREEILEVPCFVTAYCGGKTVYR